MLAPPPLVLPSTPRASSRTASHRGSPDPTYPIEALPVGACSEPFSPTQTCRPSRGLHESRGAAPHCVLACRHVLHSPFIPPSAVNRVFFFALFVNFFSFLIKALPFYSLGNVGS